MVVGALFYWSLFSLRRTFIHRLLTNHFYVSAFMVHLLLPLTIVSLVLSSCMVNSGHNDPVPPPDVNFSEEQLRALGIEIENEFNQGVANRFDQVFKPAELFKRMVWPNVPNEKETADFLKGVSENGGSLGKSLASGIAGKGKFSLLHTRKTDHGTTLLYRFVSDNEGGLSYIEFIVGESPEKQPIVVDMFTSTSGELVSQTLRRLFVSGGNGVLNQLKELVDGKDVEQVVQAGDSIQQFIAKEEYQKALEFYGELPEDIRHRKVIQLRRLRAAMSMDDSAPYLAAIEEFSQLFPEDPALILKQFDYYLLKKEYDSVFATIDRLDAEVDDPWLDYQRAEVAMAQKQYDKAVQFAEKMIRRDSTMVEPYYTLIVSALYQDDYAGVSTALERMQASGTAQIDFEGIEQSEHYVNYRASQDYQKLKQKYQDNGAIAAE